MFIYTLARCLCLNITLSYAISRPVLQSPKKIDTHIRTAYDEIDSHYLKRTKLNFLFIYYNFELCYLIGE